MYLFIKFFKKIICLWKNCCGNISYWSALIILSHCMTTIVLDNYSPVANNYYYILFVISVFLTCLFYTQYSVGWFAIFRYLIGIKNVSIIHIHSVQLLSRVWLFVTPWTAARQASLSITSSRSLPKFMSIESVMPFNHLILCHPLLLLPSIFPHQGLFKWVSSLHQMAKVLEFQLQHQSFQCIFRNGFL